MARARNIKPAFFTNELLGTVDPMVGLTFIGLWCLADKVGILEDRPLRIKAELFPYRDSLDVNGYLTVLAQLGFIVRYENDGRRFIQVEKFRKHQSPHNTEKAKCYPFSTDPKSLILGDNGYSPVILSLGNDELPVPKRPDSLIPDSLIPDSLIPDSLIPDSKSKALHVAEKPKREKAPSEKTPIQIAAAETWAAYSGAYFSRYRTEPVRNQAVNSQVTAFVKRIGTEDAPHVATYFVGMNKRFYIEKLHPMGLLLSDCEAIRTQWATNHQVTSTRAGQMDQSQANYDLVNEALAILAQQGGDNANS
jgi:hypothetical protein